MNIKYWLVILIIILSVTNFVMYDLYNIQKEKIEILPEFYYTQGFYDGVDYQLGFHASTGGLVKSDMPPNWEEFMFLRYKEDTKLAYHSGFVYGVKSLSYDTTRSERRGKTMN